MPETESFGLSPGIHGDLTPPELVMSRQNAVIILAVAAFLYFHSQSDTLAFAISWAVFAAFPARLVALQEWRVMKASRPAPRGTLLVRPPRSCGACGHMPVHDSDAASRDYRPFIRSPPRFSPSHSFSLSFSRSSLSHHFPPHCPISLSPVPRSLPPWSPCSTSGRGPRRRPPTSPEASSPNPPDPYTPDPPPGPPHPHPAGTRRPSRQVPSGVPPLVWALLCVYFAYNAYALPRP